MSQRVSTKTGRRKKKVKSTTTTSSSSSSSSSPPETSASSTAEILKDDSTIETTETTNDVVNNENDDMTLNNDNQIIISSETTTTTPPATPSTPPDTIISIPESFFLINEPKFSDYDGINVRSAIFSNKKWPLKMVSFPDNDKNIVTGYHEPANPWRHAGDVNREILISAYKKSCERHCTEPLKKVLDQLEILDVNDSRCEELSLQHENMDKSVCEPLEEIFKRVQFVKIDLESANLDDESAETLFDMIEYYESAKNLNISGNVDIGARGWTSCAQMMKKTLSLEQLDAKDIVLTQQHINILKRPLQFVTHLRILKLENCSLAGRAFVIFSALKVNTGVKELHMADNNFDIQDAIQLGSLFRVNNNLQLLDISNNKVKDEGVKHILEGVVTQSENDGPPKGLKILVLWNNHLTKNSANYFSHAFEKSKTLETINIGQNIMTDETLEVCKDSLKKNTCLLQLGMQSTGLMISGIIALAEVIDVNKVLQRIDLRDNNIQLTGLTYLSLAMKKNTTVTQIDLDDKTWSKSPALIEPYFEQVINIRDYCTRNDEEPSSTDSSTDDSSSQQHRSHLSSINSRKISLTCQTLPRSPPALSNNADNINRTTNMLEPKRTTGGRLRSPAPSPIPSPVASPIPSPSRSRFVVSRVSETSLSSTNSSASSSPITPPSITSSTCFFPTTNTTTTTIPPPPLPTTTTTTKTRSRFRVTIVEPNSNPITNNTNTNSNNNNSNNNNNNSKIINNNNSNSSLSTKVENNFSQSKRNNSDDLDSVFRSDEDEDEDDDNNNIKNHTSTLNTDKNPKNYNNDDSIPIFDNNITNLLPKLPINNSLTSSKININNKSSVLINNLQQSNIERNNNNNDDNIPKQTSGLDRLLELFQHPGDFISSKNDFKKSVKESVSNVMLLGDKFQQLLKQENPRPVSLRRSASDATKNNNIIKINNDPVKSSSISQLSIVVDDNDNNNNKEKINNYQLIDDNTDDDDNNNVPVLAYKSFVSDDDDNDLCDSSTNDSINNKKLNNKMASVCNNECNNIEEILNMNDDDDCVIEKTVDVHKIFHSNNDNLLYNYEVSNINNNNNNNTDKDNNNNQGNNIDYDKKYDNIDNDVKYIMTSILDNIPDISSLKKQNLLSNNEDDYDNNNVNNNCVNLNHDNDNSKMIVDNDCVNNLNTILIVGNNDEDDNNKCIIEDLIEANTSRSPTNLFIDDTINKKHRNSQDSGIEETNLSIIDDNLIDLTNNLQTRNSFQESVDSGFDSECSSFYIHKNELTSYTAKNHNIPDINNTIKLNHEYDNIITDDDNEIIINSTRSDDDTHLQINDENININNSCMRVD